MGEDRLADCWRGQRAARWVPFDAMSLAQPVLLPPPFSKYLLNVHCVLGTQQWIRQWPTLLYQQWVSVKRCHAPDLTWKIRIFIPHRTQPMSLLRAQTFFTYSGSSVPPLLLLDLFLSSVKQWLCWSHKARLETHSGEIPLTLQSLLSPPLSLFPWNLSLQPCDRSPRALLFVLAEVRIWRAMLLMD